MMLKCSIAGQARTHANGVYVRAGLYDAFTEMMLEATKRLRVRYGADAQN